MTTIRLCIQFSTHHFFFNPKNLSPLKLKTKNGFSKPYHAVIIIMTQTVFINHNFNQPFYYTNSPFELHFSPGIYLVTLTGASGGFTTSDKINFPGYGGLASGILKLTKPEIFYLYIGGQGSNSSAGTPGVGGFNGGIEGASDFGENNNCASAGSGGATDLRIKDGEWNSEDGLKSRIIVAGGGGSAGCWVFAGNGGDGGGIYGENGQETLTSNSIPGGQGGKQTNGAAFGFGSKGEDGTANTNGEAGGSGGGGYWGGKGGQSSCNGCSGSGGGGGSSFISGHTGCIAIKSNGEPSSSSIHYSKFRFFNTYTESGVNLGNGNAYIKGLSEIQIFDCFNKYKFLRHSIIAFLFVIMK